MGQFPDQGLEKVVAIPLRKKVADWEGHVVRRPYEKSKRDFSSCGHGGSPPWCAQREGVAIKPLNLPLPSRVLRVGRFRSGGCAKDAIGGRVCWGQDIIEEMCSVSAKHQISKSYVQTRISTASATQIAMKAHLKGFSHSDVPTRDLSSPLIDFRAHLRTT